VEKESVSPERALDRLELWLQVSEALVALPEGQRQAVSLYHLRGWTIAQICAHLDRSEASVVSLIHRGLKTLRKELKEND
jgi:RNA polymerase sigma factor (sigma-70 family)